MPNRLPYVRVRRITGIRAYFPIQVHPVCRLTSALDKREAERHRERQQQNTDNPHGDGHNGPP